MFVPEFLFTALPAVGAGVLTLGLGVFFTSRYKRCPANQVLVISGKTDGNKSARCISGGGAFVWPVIQEYDFLDLTPLPMDVDLKDALSLENIRVAVPATVTVAIGREPEIQQNAAVRMLGLDYKQIMALAQDIVLGQMRQVIASMSIEEINRDRDKFLKRIDDSLEPELKKIGLVPINVNIRDIKDASGYIEATGRKAAAQAVNQALADVAEQEKLGQIKVSQAMQVQATQVAEAERNKDIGVAEFNRDKEVSVAKANADAAQGRADASVREAEAFQRAQTAKVEAEAEVQRAQNEALAIAAKANGARVEAEKRAELEAVARAEAAKMIVDAEAKAKQTVLAAEAEAKGVFAKLKAEADGQLAIANAKAEGIRNMVEAAGGTAQDAFKLLMVDNMRYIADASAKAVSGIKFDKVVVWGGGEGGEIPNFVKNIAKLVPPLMETMTEIGGVDVKGLLGDGAK